MNISSCITVNPENEIIGYIHVLVEKFKTKNKVQVLKRSTYIDRG